MTRPLWDCVVCGAGPAGAVVAHRLAAAGRQVLLRHRERPRHPVPEETLVPAAAPLLERLGLDAIFRRHRFIGTPRHGIVWGEDRIRWREESGAEAGFKAERALLDEELRRRAVEAGAVLEIEVRGRAGRSAAAGGPEAAVRVLAAGKHAAAGTGSVVREVDRLPETVALLARVAARPGFEDATLIEAVGAGWLWWLPLRSGDVCLALFADPDEVRARGARALFDAARREAIGPARDAAVARVRGVVATPRLGAALGDVLLAGDAASTIDPLSSQGLEKALSSAEAAAMGVETILDAPDDAPLVQRHLAAREAAVFALHARRALELYARERRFADRPFWRRRHEEHRRRTVAEIALPARLAPSPALAAAVALRPRGRRFEKVPAFAVGEGPALDALNGVPVAALLDTVRGGADLATAIERAVGHPQLQILTRSAVQDLLRELVRLGFVVPAAPVRVS